MDVDTARKLGLSESALSKLLCDRGHDLLGLLEHVLVLHGADQKCLLRFDGHQPCP